MFTNDLQNISSTLEDEGMTEAIILAGGLGTRLRSVVPDLPKCMAPVNGKPFIIYVIKYLSQQRIRKFILSLGYKHERIIEYLDSLLAQLRTQNLKHKTQKRFVDQPDSLTLYHSPLSIQYSIEDEPLGTGGAIRLGCTRATEKNVLVANGDTLFKVDIMKLSAFHDLYSADCTLSLKPMKNFDRYGIVELNKDNSIKSFKEKQHYDEGLINGGLYALNVNKFLEAELPTKFSFEKDYLEKFYVQRKIYGVVQDKYFIDIGIPEDYKRAQLEFGKLEL
jgi:D-glycero-alpha-D-manno-heptose 1-phosphate guanylyltransferase